MRTIIVPSGIGDFVWIAQKLLSTGEQFHIKLPAGTPQRGHGVLKLLPQLVASYEYVDGLTYKFINANNAVNIYPKWHMIKQQEFYLSVNNQLENGHRIEKWLPDLSTVYRIDYHTTDRDKQQAFELLPGDKCIGIYTSAYSNTRNWSGWTISEWMQMIRLLGKRYTYVIIGAPYDVGIVEDMGKLMQVEGFKYVSAVGVELGGTIEILKRLSYFIGFPSGLSILNASLGKSGVMFYPAHLQRMINTWADPAMIEKGTYKGCLFPKPLELYDWMQKNAS